MSRTGQINISFMVKKGWNSNKINTLYLFKLDVLKFRKDTGFSYRVTANTFGIPEPLLIANWNRIYSQDGVNGLKK